MEVPMSPVKRSASAGGDPGQSGDRLEGGLELGPRKLIRPALADVRKDRMPPQSGGGRKASHLDQTNAEAFYYLKQMQARTLIVVRLLDGEELRGWIEWYDKDVIKLNREGAPNLVLSKRAIKYLYKEGEERGRRRRPRTERPALETP
jgi:sRNA-binding regulator protein Hfq